MAAGTDPAAAMSPTAPVEGLGPTPMVTPAGNCWCLRGGGRSVVLPRDDVHANHTAATVKMSRHSTHVGIIGWWLAPKRNSGVNPVPHLLGANNTASFGCRCEPRSGLHSNDTLTAVKMSRGSIRQRRVTPEARSRAALGGVDPKRDMGVSPPGSCRRRGTSNRIPSQATAASGGWSLSGGNHARIVPAPSGKLCVAAGHSCIVGYDRRVATVLQPSQLTHQHRVKSSRTHRTRREFCRSDSGRQRPLGEGCPLPREGFPPWGTGGVQRDAST